MCASPEDVATTASMTYDPEPIEMDGHMVKDSPSGALANLGANSIELGVWLASPATREVMVQSEPTTSSASR